MAHETASGAVTPDNTEQTVCSLSTWYPRVDVYVDPQLADNASDTLWRLYAVSSGIETLLAEGKFIDDSPMRVLATIGNGVSMTLKATTNGRPATAPMKAVMFGYDPDETSALEASASTATLGTNFTTFGTLGAFHPEFDVLVDATGEDVVNKAQWEVCATFPSVGGFPDIPIAVRFQNEEVQNVFLGQMAGAEIFKLKGRTVGPTTGPVTAAIVGRTVFGGGGNQPVVQLRRIDAGGITAGKWWCAKPGTTSVTLATYAAQAAAGILGGIALTTAAANQQFVAAVPGDVVPAGTVGLAAGAACDVIANNTGTSVRLDGATVTVLPNGYEAIGGSCTTDGDVTIGPTKTNKTAQKRAFNPQSYSLVPLTGTNDDASNGQVPSCYQAWLDMLADIAATFGTTSGSEVDLPFGMLYSHLPLPVDRDMTINGRAGGGNHPVSGIFTPAGVTGFHFDNGTFIPGAGADFAHIQNVTMRSQPLVKNAGFGGITHTRAALTTYAIGFCCFASGGLNPNRFFRATTGGTTAAGGDPGGWAAAVPGATFVDGTVTWTCEAYVRPRKSNHAYIVGDRYMNFGPDRNPVGIFGQPGTDDDNRYYYECTIAGTSDANPLNVLTLAGPSLGVTFTDGTATFVAKVHDGLLGTAPFTWQRINASGYTNAGIHHEGISPSSADFAAGMNLYCPIGCGLGLYLGTSDANGCTFISLKCIDNALFLDNLDADMVTNLGGCTLFAHSQAGVMALGVYGQVSNGRNIFAITGNNFFYGFSENGLPDLGCPGTKFIPGTPGPAPYAGLSALALDGPGGVGQFLEENDRRGTGTPGLILTHGLTIQDGYTVERLVTNHDSAGEFWRTAFQWVSNPFTPPFQAGTGWWQDSYGGQNYNPSFGRSVATASEGPGFFRLYYGKFTGLETETIAWDGYSSTGQWGLTWKNIRGGHFLPGDRVEFLDKVTPGTWRRTLVKTAGYRGQARQDAHLYFSGGVPIGYVGDLIQIGDKVFQCTTSGTTQVGVPAGYGTAIVGGTVNDGTAVFTRVDNQPTYLPWGFIDDPVTALCPQAKTLWADTADTDPATAAPQASMPGDRFQLNTPDNTANQTLLDVAIPDTATTIVDAEFTGFDHTGTGAVTIKVSGSYMRNGAGPVNMGTDDVAVKTSGTLAGTTANTTISGNNMRIRVTPGANTRIDWAGFWQSPQGSKQP